MIGSFDGSFARCSCYFHQNIYLHSLQKHVSFYDRKQFSEQFGISEEFLIAEAENEVQRRQKFVAEAPSRRKTIAEKYRRKHPDLFTFQVCGLVLQFCTQLLHFIHSEQVFCIRILLDY